MSESKNRIDIHRAGKTIGTVMAIICLLFVICFSSYISGEEFHHECSGEHCPICELLDECGNTVNHIHLVTPVVIILGVLILSISVVGRIEYYYKEWSLVSYKVRLND